MKKKNNEEKLGIKKKENKRIYIYYIYYKLSKEKNINKKEKKRIKIEQQKYIIGNLKKTRIFLFDSKTKNNKTKQEITLKKQRMCVFLIFIKIELSKKTKKNMKKMSFTTKKQNG